MSEKSKKSESLFEIVLIDAAGKETYGAFGLRELETVAMLDSIKASEHVTGLRGEARELRVSRSP